MNMKKTSIPLYMLLENEEGIIVEVYGGKGLKRRLHDLGFLPGTEIRVLYKSSGPMKVFIRGSSMALGKGVTKRIYVRRKE